MEGSSLHLSSSPAAVPGKVPEGLLAAPPTPVLRRLNCPRTTGSSRQVSRADLAGLVKDALCP